MARPGLTKHRKFLRLARAVGNAPLALGCLELIWSACYESGEDYLGDEFDVEGAAQWPGEPGALTKALLAAGGEGNPGFIEALEDRPGHFRVHDLYDHAPEYVRKRMDREAARRASGTSLRELRAAAAKASHEARRAKSNKENANGGQLQSVASVCPANGTTPAPAPAPAPIPKEEEAIASSCAEPDEPAPAPASPVLFEVPCNGTGAKTWPLTQAKLDEWTESFPGVDVRAELRRAIQWLRDNPAKAKTARGMPAFFGRWLTRVQDSAPRNPHPSGAQNGTPQQHRFSGRDAALVAQLGTARPLPGMPAPDGATPPDPW